MMMDHFRFIGLMLMRKIMALIYISSVKCGSPRSTHLSHVLWGFKEWKEPFLPYLKWRITKQEDLLAKKKRRHSSRAWFLNSINSDNPDLKTLPTSNASSYQENTLSRCLFLTESISSWRLSTQQPNRHYLRIWLVTHLSAYLAPIRACLNCSF